MRQRQIAAFCAQHLMSTKDLAHTRNGGSASAARGPPPARCPSALTWKSRIGMRCQPAGEVG